MKRVLALHIESLSIDLAQRRRSRAVRRPGAGPTSCVLLTRTAAGRSLIAARCNEAARRGVRLGLTLAEAEALIDPRVRTKSGPPWVEEVSEERDGRALHALGLWCIRRVSPIVALDPPDGLLLDIAGTERLFGSEEALCRTLLMGMHRFGLGARIAIADTIGAAWGISRFGRRPRDIVETGLEEDALAPLPVEALRVPLATAEGLAELGVNSILQLTQLDRNRVAARFGGDVALRLDQALGRAFEPVTPLVYETPPQAERSFEGPVKSLEAITQTAEALVNELAAELAHARRGLTEAVLVIAPSDLPPRQIPLALARPSADARHLWNMLKPKIETVHLGFGIERVRFTAVRTARLPTRQSRAFGVTDHDDSNGSAKKRVLDRHLGELVDVLSARLGRDKIVTPVAEATHLPESTYTWRVQGDPRPAQRPANPHVLPPRPSRLFQPPETATFDALTSTGAPRRVRWRGLAYRIRHAQGPERIARPWWEDSQHTVRDYFRLETACGRTLWTYRQPKDGRAFVHGEWS